MQITQDLVPLREFCRHNKWPRLPQWNHWITTRNTVAKKCVKKIGGRYLVDVQEFQKLLKNASLEGVDN